MNSLSVRALGAIFTDEKLNVLTGDPGAMRLSVREQRTGAQSQEIIVNINKRDEKDEAAGLLFISMEGKRQYYGAANTAAPSAYERIVSLHPDSSFMPYAAAIFGEQKFEALKQPGLKVTDTPEDALKKSKEYSSRRAELMSTFGKANVLRKSMFHKDALFYQALCAGTAEDYAKAMSLCTELIESYEESDRAASGKARKLLEEIKAVQKK